MDLGKAMCDHSWHFTLSARSLVKLPIVGVEPRARPVIDHVGVTNVVTSKTALTGETQFHCESGCMPGRELLTP